jgi:4-aminobutyrate aminotransferase
MKRWLAGAHGTTFGGNPVACAAALATLEVIGEEGLVANARAQGARLLAGLRQIKARHPSVADVRGIGLMAALEFTAPGRPKEPDAAMAQRVLDACLRRGLLLYVAGAHSQVVRMMPPLVLTTAQVDRGLSILEEAVAEAEAG